MDENYDAFDDYVVLFDLNENMISYKYMHSYRVVHQAEEICRSINTDTVERDLASNIALLHDIARFKQWKEFKTYDDSKSFDHGDEGVKLLFDEGLIDRFVIDKDDYEVVKKAIRNHNKYKIEDGLNERELMHVKIIRDADKIDILYAFSTNRLLELEEDDKEMISDEVHDEFMKHLPIVRKSVKNKNDRILMLASLVYDLNYEYSASRIKKEKYLEKMYSHLMNKKLFKPYFDEAIKYLKGAKYEQ